MEMLIALINEGERKWTRRTAYFTVLIKIYEQSASDPFLKPVVYIRSHRILLHSKDDQIIDLNDIFTNHLVKRFYKTFKIKRHLYIKIELHKLDQDTNF